MVERHIDVGGGDNDFWSGLWHPVRQFGHQLANLFSPSAEASAEADHYTVTVELPGVKQADIDVDLKNDLLTVSGEKQSEETSEGKTYFFSERRYGAFRRAFRVPQDVDADGITASFKDGVLTIDLPKLSAEDRNERKIEVGGG